MKITRADLGLLLLAVSSFPSYAQTYIGGGSLTHQTHTYKDASKKSYTQYDHWTYTDSNGTTYFQGATDVGPVGAIMPFEATLDDVKVTHGVTYRLSVDGGNGVVKVNTSVMPKFQVLGVTYAPPGPGSRVDYSSSSSNGVSVKISNSFSGSMNLSTGFSLDFGWVNTDLNISVDYTHSYENSTSEGTEKTSSNEIITENPADNINSNFIDHNYDVIDVWLNPQVDMVFYPNSEAIWATINRTVNIVNGFDTYLPIIDGKCQMDHVPLLAGWLNGSIPWPENDIRDRLARAWDKSMTEPGLTVADYASILSFDPWARQIDPSTGAILPQRTNSEVYAMTMNGGGTDKRYTFVTSIPYGPNRQTYSGTLTYKTTSQATNTHTESITVKYSTSDKFVIATVGGGASWSWTHAVENTDNSSMTKTASYTIVTPNAARQIPMDSSINIYQDNLTGSFMFAFPGGNF